MHTYNSYSLTKIYINLCKHCSKRKDTCSHQSRTLKDTSHNRTRSNLFETLQQSGTENEHATLVDEQSDQNKSTEYKGRGKEILSDEAPSRIADDGLSDAFELYQQVHVTNPAQNEYTGMQ